MTVAFNDVVILRDMLAQVKNLKDWKEMSSLLHNWHWKRKGLASTVNILSVALYDLFGADGMCLLSFSRRKLLTGEFLDDNLEVLRAGCFKYFERGGECINGPVSLLSGYVQFNP